MTLIKHIGLIFGLVALLTQPSWGAALAGHVILTKGNVTAATQEGKDRALKRRSQIFNGDIIKTGPAGSVQIRFVDKALMTIKANSEMNIERYLRSQKGNEQQKEQVLMSLVKGGFRTITGTIGKGDKDAYKVNTPAASIGIRGTNYEVQQESDGGFVMGVYSGGIQVENESGTIELGEGADFNFTRVKPKSSPKGLLAPPPSLAANTATEQNEDEGEQTAGNEPKDEGDDSNNDDSQADEDNDSSKENTSNQSLSDFASNTTNASSDISNAIDNKLATTIKNTADKVEEQLVDQGVTSIFDFKDPYKEVDASSIDNPFEETTITNQQFALAESGRLALLAIPVNSSTNSVGPPDLSMTEAQLISPAIVSASGHDFATNNGHFRLSYDVYNLTTKKTDTYEIEFVVNATTSGNGDLISFMTPTAATIYRVNGESFSGIPPSMVDITFNGSQYEFIPTEDNNNFILEMELNFDDDSSPSAATLALQKELGSNTNFNRDDWYAEVGLDMVIGNGSWDSTTNRPILVMRDQDKDQNANNDDDIEDRIEVVSKPLEADSTVNALLSFAQCIDQGKTCDIQVDTVKAGNNIRWGAWLTEPGEGIQLTEFNINDSTLEFQQEEDILAFWVAAERADINQLIGNATFSASSDCANFSQCIGFSDDGIVQNLTAQFDVNFTSGAIKNGNLTLQTTADPSIGSLGGSGAVSSTWNVNFTGQMSSDGTTKLPEFQTQSINGSVTDGSITSNNIIGNIGGVFVKPGDKFAGGYNLGTVDETNKHAAGVFSMDKK